MNGTGSHQDDQTLSLIMHKPFRESALSIKVYTSIKQKRIKKKNSNILQRKRTDEKQGMDRNPWRGTIDAEIWIRSGESPEVLRCLSLTQREGQSTSFYSVPTARNSAFVISAFAAHSTSFFPQLCSSIKRSVTRAVVDVAFPG